MATAWTYTRVWLFPCRLGHTRVDGSGVTWPQPPSLGYVRGPTWWRRDLQGRITVRIDSRPEALSSIGSETEILGGTPRFRGTRVPVDSLIDDLEAGHTMDEFLDNLSSVTREAAFAL